MGNKGEGRKKKSDKAKKTRQVNGPYSTRSARISMSYASRNERTLSFNSSSDSKVLTP